MQVVMMVTARCNASCAHCSTSCGPRRTEHLQRATMERLIDEAADLSKGEPLEISLTGGEPFLDFTLLEHVVRYGTARGATMSCVSNGSWATTSAKAVSLLERLKDAGLALLAISTSRFHQQFVGRHRVDRALAAARSIGLKCVLKYVRTADDSDDAAIREQGRRAGADRTEIIPLMPTLRDEAQLPEQQYPRAAGLPRGTCPGAILNVGEDGRAYPCCTPGAIHGWYVLGHVAEVSLKELQDRFYLDPKLQVLRRHGPTFFADAVRAHGLRDRLRPSYANVCDLCTHIARDPQMAAVAEKTARDFAMAQLRAILTAPHGDPARR